MDSSVPLEKSAEKRRRLLKRDTTAIGDLMAGLRLHELWRALAWENVIQRYRRAALGVGWIAISFMLMIAVFVLVFGRSSPVRTEFEYMVYLATGLTAFGFVSGMVSGGASIFASGGGWIKSSRAPLSVLIYTHITGAFFEMFINALVLVPLIMMQGVPSVEHLLMVVVALAIFALNGVWCCMLLGSLGAWSSDFQNLLPAIMRIAFFATPVFWDYEVVQGRRLLLAHYNPFTHFIEVFRLPLMGESPSLTNWTVVILVTIGGWIAGLIAFSMSKRRLAAWV
ncbi:ABC transporter permease [Henriciella sp. AS95]|uniref:ABC transporter permease n=1 Tax=Henriciella sp. AS95 TaxID=3135782 RepID=UPI00317581D3